MRTRILLRRRPTACCPLCFLWLLVAACQTQQDETVRRVVIGQELTLQWMTLPHRVSVLELSCSAQDEGAAATLSAQNNGGEFGVMDVPEARYAVSVWKSRRLRAVETSVWIEIPPRSEVGNLCAGASGEVAMLQFDDPQAERYAPPAATLDLISGVPAQQSVDLAPQ